MMTTVSLVILFILYTLSMLFLGFLLGVVTTASYISRELKKAQRKLEDYFGTGDEWKQDKEIDPKDESWLRKILGDDKNKEQK